MTFPAYGVGDLEKEFLKQSPIFDKRFVVKFILSIYLI